MSSKIIPGKAINNGAIINSSSTINPATPINGEMNSTKAVEDSIIYEGGTTDTARVVVDNVEEKIFTYVTKLPATFSVELETGDILYFDGSEDKAIKLNGYTIEELPATSSTLKRYALYKNDSTQVGDIIEVPKDSDLQAELDNEIQERLASESDILRLVNTKENKTSYELRNDFSTFVFEDNKEVSYSNTIDKDITLTVPANISQGFISMLTIYNMTVSKTITINNLSSYTLRIVNGSEYITDNTYSTSSEGKKIIFARCDGLNIEILIIEEVPAIW